MPIPWKRGDAVAEIFHQAIGRTEAYRDGFEVTAMPIPEPDLARVKRFCDQRVPAEALHQVRLEVELGPGAITFVERRAPWCPEYGSEWTRLPITRFRYSAITKLWTLYWRGRDLRFHVYDRVAPSRSVDALLAEVDRDPTRIF